MVELAERAWSAVAGAWDAEVDEVDEHSAAATAALLEHLALQPGERVLELASGPGSLGSELAARVGPTGAVVLSDIAEGMVAVAARRNEAVANVEVVRLDASAIDQPDGAFDAVACRMGLMFTPDPAVALGEIRRVLAPGGRLAALTWASMEHNPWMTCLGMAAMTHGVVAGPPPFAPGGIFSLGDPAQLATLAEGAGFAGVTTAAIDVTFRSPSVDAHLDRVGALAGPLAAALSSATDEQRAAVRSTAAELVAPYVTDGGVAIPGRALLVAGRA